MGNCCCAPDPQENSEYEIYKNILNKYNSKLDKLVAKLKIEKDEKKKDKLIVQYNQLRSIIENELHDAYHKLHKDRRATIKEDVKSDLDTVMELLEAQAIPDGVPAKEALITPLRGRGKNLSGKFCDVAQTYGIPICCEGIDSISVFLNDVKKDDEKNADKPDNKLLAKCKEYGLYEIGSGVTFAMINTFGENQKDDPRTSYVQTGYDQITVSGAISTGAQGMDNHITSMVVGMHLLNYDADGKIVEYFIVKKEDEDVGKYFIHKHSDRKIILETDDVVFNAVLTAMGTMGIFLNLIVKTAPFTYLREIRAGIYWNILSGFSDRKKAGENEEDWNEKDSAETANLLKSILKTAQKYDEEPDDLNEKIQHQFDKLRIYKLWNFMKEKGDVLHSFQIWINPYNTSKEKGVRSLISLYLYDKPPKGYEVKKRNADPSKPLVALAADFEVFVAKLGKFFNAKDTAIPQTLNIALDKMKSNQILKVADAMNFGNANYTDVVVSGILTPVETKNNKSIQQNFINYVNDVIKMADHRRNNKKCWITSPFSLRFAKEPCKGLLSPQYTETDKTACLVEMPLIRHSPGNHETLDDFRQIYIRSKMGRPHWGLAHGLSRYDFNQIYPQKNIEAFKNVVQKFNPLKIFSNQMTASLGFNNEEKERSKVRILQYNIFLRPWFFGEHQKERAGQIVRSLEEELGAKKFQQVDVITICEAFKADARAVFVDTLKDYGFKYVTHVIDEKNPFRVVFNSWLNGGVLIASRYPIDMTEQHIYRGTSTGWDALSAKGVVYAKIVKLGRIFHVFATHLQAFNSKDDKEARQGQIEQFLDFYDRLSNEGFIEDGEPSFLAGDLNARYGEREGLVLRKELQLRFRKPPGLFTSDPTTNNLVGLDGQASDMNCEDEYNKTGKCKCCKREWLDYVGMLGDYRNDPLHQYLSHIADGNEKTEKLLEKRAEFLTKKNNKHIEKEHKDSIDGPPDLKKEYQFSSNTNDCVQCEPWTGKYFTSDTHITMLKPKLSKKLKYEDFETDDVSDHYPILGEFNLRPIEHKVEGQDVVKFVNRRCRAWKRHDQKVQVSVKDEEKVEEKVEMKDEKELAINDE